MEQIMHLNQNIVLVALSASALPALAITALFLRRGLFTGKWKVFFMAVGLSLLLYTVYSTLQEHGDDLGWKDIFVGGLTALATTYLLARFSHGHKHDKGADGARGIVISEAFHSVIDGMVIGASYVIAPILGSAATLGILIHEAPKIFGTLVVFRGLGLSMKKTVLYGALSQMGAPAAALLVYLLGKRIDHEQFHLLEIASVSSLATIVLWIIYLEWNFHRRHQGEDHTGVHQH